MQHLHHHHIPVAFYVQQPCGHVGAFTPSSMEELTATHAEVADDCEDCGRTVDKVKWLGNDPAKLIRYLSMITAEGRMLFFALIGRIVGIE